MAGGLGVREVVRHQDTKTRRHDDVLGFCGVAARTEPLHSRDCASAVDQCGHVGVGR